MTSETIDLWGKFKTAVKINKCIILFESEHYLIGLLHEKWANWLASQLQKKLLKNPSKFQRWRANMYNLWDYT